MSGWQQLDRLGREQWGLVTRQQVLQVMDRHSVQYYRARGLLVPVHRGVYRLIGAPPSWRQRMMGACLAYGDPVAVSHRAAAVLWGLDDIVAPDCEVTVPHKRSGRYPGILTHRAPLPESQIAKCYGIPVTSMARTLLDLRGLVPDAVVERAVDQAHRLRLVTPNELARHQAGRSGRGYRGSGTFREMLDRRLAYPGVGDSVWEDRIFGWIVGAGLEAPERQVRVTVGRHEYLIDLGYSDRKVGLEFDGYDYHGRRWRFDADAVRHSELALAGWILRRVTAKQSCEEVLAWVRQALAQRPSRARDG